VTRAVLTTCFVVAFALAYSGIVHWLVTENNRSAFAVGFAVASGAATLLAIVWRAGWAARFAVVAASLGVFWWSVRAAAFWDPRWIYLIQHAGIHAVMGAYFLSTLYPPQTAIVTRMAALTRKTMPAEVVAYTRKLTGVWATYFLAMAALSLALFVWGIYSGDIWAWSILSNALTWPAIGLLACVEYFYRVRRFPNDEHIGLWESLKMTTKRDV
jgi:uncharacterized membrane protein